jgi:hypothetical protein
MKLKEILNISSGAYIAALLITLLDLPLELPKDSPASSRGMTSLLSGLPEWIARCGYPSMIYASSTNMKRPNF